ncbi:LacI family DNA-binding transcriptional regulator [Phycisphaerales bacterium AB-hyl4]|uniref:LacI family DNA-binding transcriptional regulator n=1 Tax=Natronomicrosphaera hydrolytica TaxID=3242702 RepID=A0ABV4U5U3_9BACT
MKVVTLKAVAEKAAVARSTATHVLGGRGDELGIRLETQERVRQAARELRYQPNYLARGLTGGATQTLGVIWSFAAYHPHMMMRRELAMRLHTRGYQPLMADSFNDKERVRRDLDEFRRRGVDGLIIRPSSDLAGDKGIVKEIDRWSRKVVVADEVSTPLMRQSWPAVVREVQPAMDELARHLAATGRRRPGVLISSLGGNQAKTAAFLAALESHGLPGSWDQVVSLEGLYEKSQDDHCQMFEEGIGRAGLDFRRFDALLCNCDEGAAMVLRACEQQGVRVPEDLALIGFNDSPFCKGLSPRLASIGWENAKTADLVMQLMFSQLEGKTVEGVRESVPLTFQWRESAG